MLSGSAILRVSLLLLVAGCLAALVQYLLPHGTPAPEVPIAVPATVVPTPRKIEALPAPQPDPALPRPIPAPSPPVGAETPAALAPRSTPPAQADLALPQLSEPRGEAEVAKAGDTAGPRALALFDLNTATTAQLNGLRGGGSIGRAIVQKRPYTAIDQLLSKRVLSRATYDRIKDQVTVR